jgi:Fe2+ or Zn2+ uptake regulation protein
MPEGAEKRLPEAARLMRAESIRDVYKALSDEVETLKRATIANTLAMYAEHGPRIDEQELAR